MRELVVATIGAMVLIALGLATVNATETARGDDISVIDADGALAITALKLAD